MLKSAHSESKGGDGGGDSSGETEVGALDLDLELLGGGALADALVEVVESEAFGTEDGGNGDGAGHESEVSGGALGLGGEETTSNDCIVSDGSVQPGAIQDSQVLSSKGSSGGEVKGSRRNSSGSERVRCDCSSPDTGTILVHVPAGGVVGGVANANTDRVRDGNSIGSPFVLGDEGVAICVASDHIEESATDDVANKTAKTKRVKGGRG